MAGFEVMLIFKALFVFKVLGAVAGLLLADDGHMRSAASRDVDGSTGSR